MRSVPNMTGAEVGASPDARVLTRQDADQLPVYEVVERWLHRDPAFSREHDPEHHLEELALMTVAAEWLTLWQPISMHRAILAGATPDQVAAAVGLSVRAVAVLGRWPVPLDHRRSAWHDGRGIRGCPYSLRSGHRAICVRAPACLQANDCSASSW
jgi:hypothetical protein